jgi:hypothetical protein
LSHQPLISFFMFDIKILGAHVLIDSDQCFCVYCAEFF